MLNTTSAYFKDQLVEKLQLMLATRELYILSHARGIGEQGTGQSIQFQISATQEEWRVHFNSNKDALDLPAGIKQLAEDMTSNMHGYLSARLIEVAV